MTCRKLFGAAALALFGLAPLSAPAQDAAAPPDATVYRAADVEAFYKQGVALLAEGKYSEAVAELNKAIAKDGAYPEALLAKGDALKAMADFQGAGTAYTRAIDFDANMAAAYNGRGECFMEMTPPDYNMAFNDFSTTLNLDSRNVAALSNLGHVLVITGQSPTEALRVLDETLALNDKDARAYRDRGMAHAQLREFDKALIDVNRAVEADPGDYENYQTLAAIHQSQLNYPEEAAAWTKAIENYKPKKRTDAESYIGGYIYRADARLKIAENEINSAARTVALEGAVADANSVLSVYEDRFPESGLALFRRGRAERMLDRYSSAVDSFTKAVQLVPPGQDINYIADAYLFRGICWYYIGSLDLARGDFEQASSTGNGFQDPRVYLWIGFTYHKQGDYRRAIDAYSQAIAKSPLFALAHVNRGRAYMDLGEYKKAVESFNDAIRSEPEVGDHYYNVALANIKQEQFQTATEFLNIALRKENPQPKMYRAMATALRGLGRDELANQYERQAETPGGAAGTTNATGTSTPPSVQ